MLYLVNALLVFLFFWGGSVSIVLLAEFCFPGSVSVGVHCYRCCLCSFCGAVLLGAWGAFFSIVILSSSHCLMGSYFFFLSFFFFIQNNRVNTIWRMIESSGTNM